MEKEKDEITNLFHSRLAETEMTVRDGFWEALSQDISAACQHRRRILLFRVAAAASVLLVLAASSATFWYLSPREEIGEAFTQIAVANGGAMDGDGVRIHSLPQSVEPVLSKPTPSSYGMLPQYTEEEDSVSVTVEMSFSFSTVTSIGGRRGNQTKYGSRFFRMISESEEVVPTKEEATSQLTKTKKAHRWAVKAQVGTALPAESGTYKMPISLGATVERKLNECIGIEAGLLYSNLQSVGQNLHYLGIPVKVNATFVNTKRVDLYATAGGIVDKCVAGAPNNGFKEEPIQLAVTAGIGINYKVTDRIAVFAESGVSHHFDTDSKLATVRTKRPTNFNLLCGIRMTY